MSRQQVEGTIHISDITLNVREEFGKEVQGIQFRTDTGSLKEEVVVAISPGDTHKQVFDPARGLSVRDRLKIFVQYRGRWAIGTSSTTIHVALSEANAEAHDGNDGTRRYFKLRKGIEVIVGISSYSAASAASAPLSSITGEILRICPRFRLLVVGNGGVGKSSLIRKVFGVKEVHVAESSRGQANIDQEFIAKENGLFVVHDSLGIEAGEKENFAKVQDFIGRRRKMPELKDRLHAIWVCIAVPYASGRIFEAGMEELFQRRTEILGNIPIVVVLTKLDLLDSQLRVDTFEIDHGNVQDEKAALQLRRNQFLNENCAKPLQLAAGGEIPTIAVSTESSTGLETTISDLVKITTSEIERHVKADLSLAGMTKESGLEHDAALYVAGMAQRASIEEKVNHTIALGKKRYWKNLAASLTFSGDNVKEYLLVIHEDIVQGWNFNDPEMALREDKFKGSLLDTSNLGVQAVRELQVALGPVMPVVTTLAPLITDMIGVVFVLPVTATLIFIKLCSEVYRSSQTIVKLFMAYIADLIYVMKILFILAPGGSITSQDVALAVNVYEKSTYKNRVHLEIRDFNASLMILPGGRDAVMEKIELIIKRFDITDEEVVQLRNQTAAGSGSSGNIRASS